VSRLGAVVQTPAPDRTKGRVGFTGTVVETQIFPPRSNGDLVALTYVIACGDVRIHITQMFDGMDEALRAQRSMPAGSHLQAFGEAAHLQLRHGELHLATDHILTFKLQTDAGQQERLAA
jgi:hypothetical protein